jgi:hypothetical protein
MRKIIVLATLIFPLLAGGALAAPTYGMPGYSPPSYGPLAGPSYGALAGPNYGALAGPDYGWRGTMPAECMGTSPDWGHCLYDNHRHDNARAISGGSKGGRR